MIGTTTVATGGTVTVTSALVPAISLQDGVIGTLTIQGNSAGGTFLTVAGSAGAPSNLNFDLGQTTTDKIAVTNNGTMTLNAGGATVNLNALSGTVLQPGTYNLLTYAAGST